jgi:HlyD family secretion protein
VIALARSAAVAGDPTPTTGEGAPLHEGRGGDARQRPSRFLVYAAIAGLVVLAAVAAWRATHKAGPPRYVTVPVARGTVAPAVTASGAVNPRLLIQVGTYVSGPIIELYCDYNTPVKRGQLCAKIDPRPYQTVVDQDRAQLATAEAQLAKDSANLGYARIIYGRLTALLAKDYVTQDSVDQVKTALAQATAQVQLDAASIANQQAALGGAELNLGYTDIVSPVDGTVISRNVTMGQTVAASFQTPTLFVIATDLTKMEVDANSSESDIGNIKVGDSASFTVEAFPERAFAGRVLQVRQSPQSVQNVVTYDVVIGVENPDLLLKPGMTATCQIFTARRDHVLRVPDAALRFSPIGLAAAKESGPSSGAQVWVMRNGLPVAVPIQPGLDDGTYTEVVHGALHPGDLVVTGEASAAPGAPPRSA